MAPAPTVATKYEFDDDEDDDHVALNLSSQQLQKEQDDYIQQQEQSLGAGASGGKKTKRFDEDDELAHYRDEEEMYGVREVLSALTKDEIESFPDEQMPLRHYRAEDVRIICVSWSNLSVSLSLSCHCRKITYFSALFASYLFLSLFCWLLGINIFRVTFP